MSRDRLETYARQARAHANALAADLNNAATRSEYIRLSILAHEADRLAQDLEIELAASAVV